MEYIKNAFKRQAVIEVVGGRHTLKWSFNNRYRMVSEKRKHGQGVVKIRKKLYYLVDLRTFGTAVSGGKVAAGAAVGGVLTGGLGAVLGAVIGGANGNDIVDITLLPVEGGTPFTLQARCIRGGGKVAKIQTITQEKADELGVDDV